MNTPRLCLICGTDSISPKFQDATLSVSFKAKQCTIQGVRAYFCENSHFFVVIGGKAMLDKRETNIRGARPLLQPSR